MGRIHRDAERHVDEELVAAHLELRRMLLGELDRGVHDGRHRVDADQHREATAGEADDRSARRQDLAELRPSIRSKEFAALLAERARNSIERVELAQQQTGEPSLLPLLQEFLDELDTRAAALRRSSLSTRRAHAASAPNLPVGRIISTESAFDGCARSHAAIARPTRASVTQERAVAAGTAISDRGRHLALT